MSDLTARAQTETTVDVFVAARSRGDVPGTRCASLATELAMMGATSVRADPPAQPPARPPEPAPAPSEVIYVTSTTPLHGSHLPKDHVAANVQVISAEDLADHESLDLSAYAGEAL